jgi:hypothetical protein
MPCLIEDPHLLVLSGNALWKRTLDTSRGLLIARNRLSAMRGNEALPMARFSGSRQCSISRLRVRVAL